MNKVVLRQLRKLCPGCLIRVEWYDASIGKSRRSFIDVPALSYGLFLAVMGDMNKHIVLCQNSFRYTDGMYEVDYTAIPLDWSIKITLIREGEVTEQVAKELLNSFVAGRYRTLKRRTENHGP